MIRYWCCLNTTHISLTAAAIVFCIAVENLLPESSLWNADTVIITWNRGKVAHYNNHIFCGFSFSSETYDALFPVLKINPLKPFRFKVTFIQAGFRFIKIIQILHPLLDAMVIGIFKQMPVKACLVVPLRPLTKLATHEEQFFTWMCVHITKQQAKVGKFLPVITGHFLQ